MADVRQLLRAERASRRITHPHASYTSDGKLLCNLCDTFVKSEAQWQSHLHSTQHNLRSQKARDARERDLRGAGTKRKAEDSPELDETGGSADEQARAPKAVKIAEDAAEEEPAKDTPAATNGVPHQDEQPKPETFDEAELLAFERELAALESEPPNTIPSALNATATISAAPLTAEQLAAQATEEQATRQRGRRDVEVEAEKEDAERVLEEEFEEMQGLEERVKRLRERRELLRRGSSVGQEGAGGGGGGGGGGWMDAGGGGAGLTNRTVVHEDDEDDDDEFDDWGFGGAG